MGFTKPKPSKKRERSPRKKTKTIAWKLRAGFMILVWLLVFRGMQSTYQIYSVSKNLQNSFQLTSYGSTTILETQNHITTIYSLMQNMSGHQTLTESEISQLYSQMKELEGLVFDNIAGLEDLAIASEDIRNLKLQFIAWNPIREEVVNLTLAGMPEVANAIAVDMSESHVSQLKDTVDHAIWVLNQESAQNQAASDDYVNRSIFMSAVLIFLLFGLSLFISKRVYLLVIPPIGQVEGVASELAKGQLQVALEGKDREDEIGSLIQSFDQTVTYLQGCIGEISHVLTCISNKNLAVDVNYDYKGDFQPIKGALESILGSLDTMLREITVSVDVMTTTATNLGETSVQLMEIVDDQAQGVESLSTNVTLVSTQAGQNMESAKSALDLSKDIQTSAEHGTKDMESLLVAMEDISQVSSKISSVLGTIDSIAFQTNILALNASIEAARAGTMGRGFAVVAEDVRRLAGESSAAAEQTRALVEDSLRSIQIGSQAADRTAESFRSIASGVEESMVLSDKIYSASTEQNHLIAQIEGVATTIQSVSKRSRSISTINSEESQRLAHQTKTLTKMMHGFQLREEELHEID